MKQHEWLQKFIDLIVAILLLGPVGSGQTHAELARVKIWKREVSILAHYPASQVSWEMHHETHMNQKSH